MPDGWCVVSLSGKPIYSMMLCRGCTNDVRVVILSPPTIVVASAGAEGKPAVVTRVPVEGDRG